MSWQKGVSGNPNGRPKKGTSLADIMREEGEKEDLLQPQADGSVKKVSYRKAIAKNVLRLAAMESVEWAIKFYRDTVDGMPVQRNENINATADGFGWSDDGEEQQPISIEFKQYEFDIETSLKQ